MYVVIEGIDGSGKDRQAKLLIERLIAEGRHVVASQEPNEATPIGQLLRKLLKNGNYPDAMLPLFLADRAASEPARAQAQAEGADIVQTRSFLSTLVYQGLRYSDGLLVVMHRELLKVWPDVIVVLDVPLKVAADRRRERNSEVEVYELGEWQQRVAKRYATFVALKQVLHTPIVAVDGTGTPEEVHQRVWEATTRWRS